MVIIKKEEGKENFIRKNAKKIGIGLGVAALAITGTAIGVRHFTKEDVPEFEFVDDSEGSTETE